MLFLVMLVPLRAAAQEVSAIDTTNAEISENPIKKTRPKVALVLSGGGAKGFAEIGVLKVPEREGIPVDIIVGTAYGSTVPGL